TTSFSNVTGVNDISNDGLYVERTQGTPTVIRFFKTPSIALSLSITDTIRQSNGTLNVKYQAIVKNNGKLNLSNVVLTDSLTSTYFTPVSYSMVGTPSLNAGSTLLINTAYNGGSNPYLTLPSSTLLI